MGIPKPKQSDPTSKLPVDRGNISRSRIPCHTQKNVRKVGLLHVNTFEFRILPEVVFRELKEGDRKIPHALNSQRVP